MVNNFYPYLFFSLIVVLILGYILFNFKTSRHNISNKILLKNLLESFDLELPDELKRLDNSSADTPKF